MKQEPNVQILAISGLTPDEQAACRKYAATATSAPSRVTLETDRQSISLRLTYIFPDDKSTPSVENSPDAHV